MSDQKKEPARQKLSDEQIDEVSGGKITGTVFDPQLRQINKLINKAAEKMVRKTIESAPTPFIAGNAETNEAEDAVVTEGGFEDLLQ